MSRFFIIPLSIFMVIWGQFLFSSYSEAPIALSQKEAQIQQIDDQIHELEEMKRGFESKAERHEDQASRLQFDDQTYLEMRRHTQLAEEYRAKAAATQKEINRLKEERTKIIN